MTNLTSKILNGAKKALLTTSLIAAPFIYEPNRWAIYRNNGVEVSFKATEHRISEKSKRLTKVEFEHILKYILNENSFDCF